MKKVLFSAILILLTTSAFAQDFTAKADFIFKVIDQVTWPAGKETGDNGAVLITVVGDSPMTAELQKLAAKTTPGGKKVEVRTATVKDDFAGSQVVIVGVKELPDLATILKKVNGQPVLTISDNGTFAGFGVMVDFLKDKPDNGAPVSFAVNRMTMKDAGLKISDNIVKLAKKTYG